VGFYYLSSGVLQHLRPLQSHHHQVIYLGFLGLLSPSCYVLTPADIDGWALHACCCMQAEAAAALGTTDSEAESRMSDAQSEGFGDDGELDERPGTPESQRF